MARHRKPSKERKINPTYFIFCEGKTEVAYINFLKRKYRISSIQIHAAERGNNISEQYIANYKKDKFTDAADLNFLMYDLDAPKMQERLTAISDTILLASNPCIELWFLLHLKNQTANIDSKTCIHEIENRCKGYNKGSFSKTLFDTLNDSEYKAISRAKELGDNKNPSSTIYLLLEKLESFKK
jgi:hypothetical protein